MDACYSSERDGGYTCTLCPHFCDLKVGEAGRCMVRIAREGGIELEAYGDLTNVAVEPIEKKPFFHFMPSSKVLSVGGYGCSMSCNYCQNWMVSQRNRAKDAKRLMPEEVCAMALNKGCQGVCMTYNEPTVYFEYLMDLSHACKQVGLYFVVKTNGMLNEEPWKKLCHAVDGLNIDYKGPFERWKQVTGIDSQAVHAQVLQNIVYASRYPSRVGCSIAHCEISVPVYPDANIEEFDELASMLEFGSGEYRPVHLLKMLPANKTTSQIATPDELVLRVREYLYEKKMLMFVYVHNIFTEEARNFRDTHCALCGRLVARRQAMQTELLFRDPSTCYDCGDCKERSYFRLEPRREEMVV